jgi:hypothetical protein
MSFTDLGPQEVRHHTGATVGSLDRYTIEYAAPDGRSLRVPVERGVDYYYFTLPATPAWSDGTPLTEREIETAIDIIREAHSHWGIQSQFERVGR